MCWQNFLQKKKEKQLKLNRHEVLNKSVLVSKADAYRLEVKCEIIEFQWLQWQKFLGTSIVKGRFRYTLKCLFGFKYIYLLVFALKICFTSGYCFQKTSCTDFLFTAKPSSALFFIIYLLFFFESMHEKVFKMTFVNSFTDQPSHPQNMNKAFYCFLHNIS